MAQSKKRNKILTAIIVIIVLILTLGLLGRLTGGLIPGTELTVTYNGRSYKSDATGLEIAPESEFGVKLGDEKAGYEVKIYAAGSAETDFIFTVAGTEYSWYADIAGANGGQGEDFTSAFEVTQTESGFTVSCGLEKALRDIWPNAEIELPEVPAGDRFRMEVTSGKTTLTIGFSVKETGYNPVTGIGLEPGEIIF